MGGLNFNCGTTYLSFYSALSVPQSHPDRLASPMSEFIDKLLIHLPHVLRVILRIAFYFSLLAIFLPRLTSSVFHSVECLLSRLAERKTPAFIVLFFMV